MENFLEEIQDESVEFKNKIKERKLTPLLKDNVRKRKDGYYTIRVSQREGDRFAIVPKDTIEKLVKEGTSLRVLKDRSDTLSALTQTFDKPLMYYAIVAYNLVPKEVWTKWNSSTPLLEYELVHLNGDIDDIRKENVRLALKDEKVWNNIKKEYKSQSKTGANVTYQKIREEFLRSVWNEYPNLKIMTRVTDVVKKNSTNIERKGKQYSAELLETIS